MILVTGATGKVGGELVRALARRGEPVRAALRDPARRPTEWGSGVEPVAFDLTQSASYSPALSGARALFLLRPPSASFKRALVPFVEAAERAGVKRCVYLSVQGAARTPWIPHRQVELFLETRPLETVFLRPAYFMQNLSTTHRDDVRERDQIFVPAGDGRTALVDVRDVAEVAAEALAGPRPERRAVELTAEALTYGEMAATLSRVLGREIVYTRPSPLRFFLELRRRGVPLSFIFVMVILYRQAARGRAGRLSGDLAALLGRAPTSFETFARDHAEVWREPPAASGI